MFAPNSGSVSSKVMMEATSELVRTFMILASDPGSKWHGSSCVGRMLEGVPENPSRIPNLEE